LTPSFWEFEHWFDHPDFTVVGAGFTGLSTAIHLKKARPHARVLLLDRAPIPQGGSTKNAGFACFGSPSEVLMDLETHESAEVVDLVRRRWQGIQKLRELVGDRPMNYEGRGSHEVYLRKDEALKDRCLDSLEGLNELLSPIFGQDPYRHTSGVTSFNGICSDAVAMPLEGQLNPVGAVEALGSLCDELGVRRLNGWELTHFQPNGEGVLCRWGGLEFTTGALCITTNGFAERWIPEEVEPARAQVLITHPVERLDFQGSFHLDRGYTYFRTVGKRVLLGGGRQLDPEGERTGLMGTSSHIQAYLEELLREVILPGREVRIDRRWSGIMGVGRGKQPVLRRLEGEVYAAVRLGGMGVALGALLGEELASMVLEQNRG